MNNFKVEPLEIREKVLEELLAVVDSGAYILGQTVDRFEKQWAAMCGVKWGVGVGNGMDAIEIALRALKIGPGDEVITTPMTAIATILAIIRSGATPVLADINPESALMSIDSVERCLSNRTKAVVLVHLYGQIRNMEKWCFFCEKNHIYLVEDCAQSHIADYFGRMAGSFGVVGAFSFYPTKNLGSFGDAGMLVTNCEEIAIKSKVLRNYGQTKRYYHDEIGLNSRLDEIQAAVLIARAKWLCEFTARRQRIAAKYQQHIVSPEVNLLNDPDYAGSHVYHLYVIKCKNREPLQKFLFDQGVQTLIHYPIPVHRQEAFSKIIRDPIGLENSESHSKECLSLPCHPYMTDDEVHKVIHLINSFKN